MMEKVFVYGTLRRGERLAHHMHGTLIGEILTQPLYDLFSLGPFPALSPVGTTRVRGELWEVPEEVLLLLDKIEGHPRLYIRGTVDLEVKGHTPWAYFMSLPRIAQRGGRLMPSGDWLRMAER